MSIFSCKHVAKSINKSLEQQLSLKESLTVRMHLLMCQNCRFFKRQMLFLRRVSRLYSNRSAYQSDGPQAQLPPKSKQRLKNLLQNLRDSKDSES